MIPQPSDEAARTCRSSADAPEPQPRARNPQKQTRPCASPISSRNFRKVAGLAEVINMAATDNIPRQSEAMRARKKATRHDRAAYRRAQLQDLMAMTRLRPAAFARLMGVNATTLRSWLKGERLTPESAIGCARWASLLAGVPVKPDRQVLTKRSFPRDILPKGWRPR